MLWGRARKALQLPARRGHIRPIDHLAIDHNGLGNPVLRCPDLGKTRDCPEQDYSSRQENRSFLHRTSLTIPCQSI